MPTLASARRNSWVMTSQWARRLGEREIFHHSAFSILEGTSFRTFVRGNFSLQIIYFSWVYASHLRVAPVFRSTRFSKSACSCVRHLRSDGQSTSLAGAFKVLNDLDFGFEGRRFRTFVSGNASLQIIY